MLWSAGGVRDISYGQQKCIAPLSCHGADLSKIPLTFQVLQLEDVRCQVVGDGGARGISGGQRKVFAAACCCQTDPSASSCPEEPWEGGQMHLTSESMLLMAVVR